MWKRVLLILVVAIVLFFFAPKSWFYQRRRPTLAGRWVNRAWVGVTSAGLVPECWPGEPRAGTVTLETIGRRSGKTRANVVTWVEVDGARYLVSMLGENVDWVRNARAAGGAATIRRGKRRPVQLKEVPPLERPSVLKAYLLRTAMATQEHLGVAPGDPLDAFDRIAPDHPVFRIVEVTEARPAMVGQAEA